ncbi:MAG: 2-amino-4-hydroxy-6-hydroxymethyldihydropteridine diphosphokinase [Alphaproteobacteria bacterium]|nr:MAG: 2-amino-4-hydroxy-6-hydroxymethyldihydropteridine diphosphokinase [Alphaproteobacteria bacterium]
MILIALGANLPHPVLGPPEKTLTAALKALQARFGIALVSRLYRTAPVPVSDQPWFMNAVVAVESALEPDRILSTLHEIEAEFGRVRVKRWEARILDLDLISAGDLVTHNRDQQKGLVLPHPRMESRAFVIAPLAEILPAWRHPVSDLSARELLKRLPPDQEIEVMGPLDTEL